MNFEKIDLQQQKQQINCKGSILVTEHKPHTVLSLSVARGPRPIFEGKLRLKISKVKFKFIFCRKSGKLYRKYHKKTTNDIVELHVLCSINEIMLF